MQPQPWPSWVYQALGPANRPFSPGPTCVPLSILFSSLQLDSTFQGQGPCLSVCIPSFYVCFQPKPCYLTQ